MQTASPAWYCVRTKPKHEHIATANLRKQLALLVFFPRIRIEKLTLRGQRRVVEPLFPCYVFVHCIVEEAAHDIQHVSGVSRLVRFGC